jgi:hypothetical protein
MISYTCTYFSNSFLSGYGQLIWGAFHRQAHTSMKCSRRIKQTRSGNDRYQVCNRRPHTFTGSNEHTLRYPTTKRSISKNFMTKLFSPGGSQPQNIYSTYSKVFMYTKYLILKGDSLATSCFEESELYNSLDTSRSQIPNFKTLH